MIVTIDIDKARAIADDKRRAARAILFAPLDNRIALAIPGEDLVAIEAQRQEIRDLDAMVQAEIAVANDVGSLKSSLVKLEPTE